MKVLQNTILIGEMINVGHLIRLPGQILML